MIISCFTLAFLIAATSAWRLDQFALTTDYDSFFDEILSSVLSQIPSYLTKQPIEYDVSKTNSSGTPIAKFSCPNPILGNIISARRTSTVIYDLGPGNLTLSTNLTFGNLMLNCPQSKVTVSEHEFNGYSSATVTKNLFQISFTVYSDENGSCALRMNHAGFVTLDEIGISFVPLGYFEMLQLTALVKHLDQSNLRRLDFDMEHLQHVTEKVVCSYVAAVIPN